MRVRMRQRHAGRKDESGHTRPIERAEVGGGAVEAFYLTMGPYDTVAVVTLPDDATMAKLALWLGAAGNVRTVTMRAFAEEEYRNIVTSL